MPLRYSKNGRECPLGNFQVKVVAETEYIYTANALEICKACNFGDNSKKDKSIDEICLCPVDMTVELYEQFLEKYIKSGGGDTQKDFLRYVKKNYNPKKK